MIEQRDLKRREDSQSIKRTGRSWRRRRQSAN